MYVVIAMCPAGLTPTAGYITAWLEFHRSGSSISFTLPVSKRAPRTCGYG